MMQFVSPPFFLKWIFPHVTWHRSRNEKILYLTFDDGPIPEITPWILDTLKDNNAKATFFCVGENIIKHPDIFSRTLAEGHQVGNHTYNHLKGWHHSIQSYLENVDKCQQLTRTSLFRPPYLKPTKAQLKRLKDDYELVFFDVLSYDFDQLTTPEQCWQNVLKATKNGSIIVFHDNIKAIENVKYVLPKLLKHYSQLGYTFAAL